MALRPAVFESIVLPFNVSFKRSFVNEFSMKSHNKCQKRRQKDQTCYEANPHLKLYIKMFKNINELDIAAFCVINRWLKWSDRSE